MNDLEKYFYNNSENLIHKWKHYFEIYDKYFSKYKNKDLNILEIGVFQGGSLKMWKEYFGNNVKIYGVDINPACKSLEQEGIEIIIGSQEDRQFLQKLKSQLPPIDILIDDGGHTMKQQIITFEVLFDVVKDDGLYICEDLHTSYWYDYEGGYKRKTSFIEYSKNFIDYLHAWHSRERSFKINNFTKSVHSIHYYDSMIVIEKRKISHPEDLTTGNYVIPIYKPDISFLKKVNIKIRSLLQKQNH